MKKILWFSSILIIFINSLFVVAFPAYPFVESVLTSFCVLAILFMLYVFFFEEKTSKFLRTTSLAFGIAGLTRIVFQIISLDNFVLNIVLLGITFTVMLIVLLPAIIGKMVKE
jgi:low temperature requirement protein LtrA